MAVKKKVVRTIAKNKKVVSRKVPPKRVVSKKAIRSIVPSARNAPTLSEASSSDSVVVTKPAHDVHVVSEPLAAVSSPTTQIQATSCPLPFSSPLRVWSWYPILCGIFSALSFLIGILAMFRTLPGWIGNLSELLVIPWFFFSIIMVIVLRVKCVENRALWLPGLIISGMLLGAIIGIIGASVGSFGFVAMQPYLQVSFLAYDIVIIAVAMHLLRK